MTPSHDERGTVNAPALPVPSAAGSRVLDLPHERTPDATSGAGSRTWALRGRNAVVLISELVGSDAVEERDVPDEYALLVGEHTDLTVHHDGAGTTRIAEPAFVVVPPGTSAVVASGPCTVVRVFTTWCAGPTALAPDAGRDADERVIPLPVPASPLATRTRVHPLREVPEQADRLGRVFRTSSLMVNWFPDQWGPRDTEALTPHAHEDFEQISLTLHGDYVHHLRTPWTPEMSRWRDDEHLEVGSPSMLLIPPTLIHTTAATGSGRHRLVDVFAPPRADFLARRWVLNAGDYQSRRDDGALP
jgi:mannose-6-phosphate isomerase-like protein (cupin superfamily)